MTTSPKSVLPADVASGATSVKKTKTVKATPQAPSKTKVQKPQAAAKRPATPKVPPLSKPTPILKKEAPVSPLAVSSEDKTKKPKLVRDSFTMPKSEYQQIETLKMSLAKQGRVTKKSELLRAGLMLLSKQSPGALLACVQALMPVKTGRPKKR